MRDELQLEHRVLYEVLCDEVEDGKGNETSLKCFAIKASTSEMVSLGEGGEKTVGVKISLAGGCREWNKISRQFWRESSGAILGVLCTNTI